MVHGQDLMHCTQTDPHTAYKVVSPQGWSFNRSGLSSGMVFYQEQSVVEGGLLSGVVFHCGFFIRSGLSSGMVFYQEQSRIGLVFYQERSLTGGGLLLGAVSLQGWSFITSGLSLGVVFYPQ